MKSSAAGQLRPPPVVASVISALAAMISCDVAGELNKSTDIWPMILAGVGVGYLTFRVLAPARAPESPEAAAERELSARRRGGFAWRAAIRAWLLCIGISGFLALDVKFIQFTLHEKSNVPVIDTGLGLGFFFGIPIALGVLLLGYRRPERLPNEPASPSVAGLEKVQAPPHTVSLELAAAIGVLTGVASCGFTMARISEEWGIPVGILVSLVVFKLVSYAREEDSAHVTETSTSVLVETSRSTDVPAAVVDPEAAEGAPLPWKLAALVWTACVVAGGMHASSFSTLTTTGELRSLIARGMLAGAMFGVPLALAVLVRGWRRRAAPRPQVMFQRPAVPSTSSHDAPAPETASATSAPVTPAKAPTKS